ncbi:hypothetical protein DQM14_02160 [Limosilactobacillus fermentum]|uniref:host-nuclease inhibitor Gam family protein n=1 Tax=Limosilactobacillus fermentum TaxID=1613 RepID=UPI000E08D529|nr:host-nuclease inhibitor Gam family protein [Limosilactobacillus fermentum]RDG20908.1 hypothetical protein DQM14_02160 [Limosilactobacillus fermentum]
MEKVEEIKAIKPTQEDVAASFKESEHQEDRFKIENTSQLEWAFRKIAEADSEIKGQEKILADTKQFVDQNIKEKKHTIETMKDLIAQYCESMGPDFKYSGPVGRAVWTEYKPSISKSDESSLIKQFGGTDFVENSPKLKWGELKKNLIAMPDGRVVTSDGELVEGAKSLAKPSEFKLKRKNENGTWEDIK